METFLQYLETFDINILLTSTGLAITVNFITQLIKKLLQLNNPFVINVLTFVLSVFLVVMAIFITGQEQDSQVIVKAIFMAILTAAQSTGIYEYTHSITKLKKKKEDIL